MRSILIQSTLLAALLALGGCQAPLSQPKVSSNGRAFSPDLIVAAAPAPMRNAT